MGESVSIQDIGFSFDEVCEMGPDFMQSCDRIARDFVDLKATPVIRISDMGQALSMQTPHNRTLMMAKCISDSMSFYMEAFRELPAARFVPYIDIFGETQFSIKFVYTDSAMDCVGDTCEYNALAVNGVVDIDYDEDTINCRRRVSSYEVLQSACQIKGFPLHFRGIGVNCKEILVDIWDSGLVSVCLMCLVSFHVLYCSNYAHAFRVTDAALFAHEASNRCAANKNSWTV